MVWQMNHFESYLEEQGADLLTLTDHIDNALQSSLDRSCVVQPAGQSRQVTEYNGLPYPVHVDENDIGARERVSLATTFLAESGIRIETLLKRAGVEYDRGSGLLPDAFSATYAKGSARKRAHGIAKLSIASLKAREEDDRPTAAAYNVSVAGQLRETEVLAIYTDKGEISGVHFEVVLSDASEQLRNVCARIFADEQQQTVRAIMRGDCDAETFDKHIRELNRSYPRLPEYGKHVPNVLTLLRSYAAASQLDKQNSAIMRDLVGPSFYWPTVAQIRGIQTALS
jgi:hypothetical protein